MTRTIFASLCFLVAACHGDAPDKPAEPTTAPAKPVEAPAPAPAATAPSFGIAIVFETQHLWLGNDTWWPADKPQTSKVPGVWKDLSASLDALSTVGVADAQVALVAFGNGARTLWTGPLAQLSGARLGAEKDLTATPDPDGKLLPQIGEDVDVGIDEAIVDLDKMNVDRKLLVVIGDGNNLHHDTASLAREHVEVAAIYLPEPTGTVESDLDAMKKLAPGARVLGSPDGLRSVLAALVSVTAK